jgi:hypothetical protein
MALRQKGVGRGIARESPAENQAARSAPMKFSLGRGKVHFCFTFGALRCEQHRKETAMVVAVVLLWVCGIMPGTYAIPGEKWLPTERERLEQQQKATEASKSFQRREFVRRWLEERMAKETAERLERAQSALIQVTKTDHHHKWKAAPGQAVEPVGNVGLHGMASAG